MENSYLTTSIKQSGWKYFEKLLSEQGRFSVFRVVKKLVKRSCSLNKDWPLKKGDNFLEIIKRTG